MDNIQKAHIGVLVPDGVAIKNAFDAYLTDQLLSTQAVYYGALDYTFDTAPVQTCIRLWIIMGTGKTLYTYQAPQTQKALNNLDTS